MRAALFHAVPSTGSTPAERFLALAEAAPERYLVVDGAAAPEVVAEQVRARLVADGLL